VNVVTNCGVMSKARNLMSGLETVSFLRRTETWSQLMELEPFQICEVWTESDMLPFRS
jgi:hypothetical protein